MTETNKLENAECEQHVQQRDSHLLLLGVQADMTPWENYRSGAQSCGIGCAHSVMYQVAWVCSLQPSTRGTPIKLVDKFFNVDFHFLGEVNGGTNAEYFIE